MCARVRQTDRQSERQTHRDRQAGRQVGTSRQTDRQSVFMSNAGTVVNMALISSKHN